MLKRFIIVRILYKGRIVFKYVICKDLLIMIYEVDVIFDVFFILGRILLMLYKLFFFFCVYCCLVGIMNMGYIDKVCFLV